MPSQLRNRSQTLAPDTWTAAASGDDAARTRLIQHAWRSIRPRLATFSEPDRDDVHQEVASAVLRALEVGRKPRANLSAFLGWLARAGLKQHARRRMRPGVEADLGALLDALVGAERPPYEELSAQELRRVLRECVDGLVNNSHRRAWRDRLERGLQPHETAQELAVPSVLVRTWIRRGAAEIRARLQQRIATD